MALSSSNPGAALADAEQWSRSGGAAPADHCAALALVALKRYGEAGARLDRAARAKALPSLSYRVELFSQAGNAWLLAGDGARAVQSFTSALALSPGDADLFSDLARAHAMRRNWREVDMDLSAALQVNPRRADLLVLRASARRALQRHADANADIAAALKLKPNDGGALLERGLLRKQLGDINGAKRDFAAAANASSTTCCAGISALIDRTPRRC
jgi:Tfp pilus assembly protein PilF